MSRRSKAWRAARAAQGLAFGTTKGVGLLVSASHRRAGRGRQQTVDVALFTGSEIYRPEYQLAKAISDALDPSAAPGRVKRFSPEEIAKLNAEMAKRTP